ncbi:MAG: Anaphase-promoting complex, cyclosome, subunit 3 [Clostridiales bacterium]|jgi:tetratricopeptide (TPR) repeat protein|nr:Anaphase-promoting complex, cyclosome, subunit 3 [Clostridiales bacterium]MDN5281925.1 Anaphase-promoting complex, cyclosome, subunit 3 [Candidatus Ozemobacter sp.]
MGSKVPTVIKEHKNMKRNHLFIILAILAIFLPVHRAFLAGSNFSRKPVAPVAPMAGRKAEKSLFGMLNNSGTEYGTWVRKGKAYIKRREYEQAILAFRKAIFLRPAEEEARFLLAWCYEKRGLEGLPGDQTNWDRLAEKEYRTAISLADHLPSRFNLALLMRRLQRFTEAREQLEHILLTGGSNSLTKKAQAELTAIFHQDMRPRHISVDIKDLGKRGTDD